MSLDVVPTPPAIGRTADINAAFATERAAQLDDARNRQADLDARIAQGTLVPLGGDRYRILDSENWDNGEVVTLRGGQLVAEHGLDTTTGSVALFSSVPAWHGLGTVVPGGLSNIDRVLELAGIDFEVTKTPALYRPDPDDPDLLAEIPGRWATVRDDTRAALGDVGDIYTVLQNRNLFGFMQDLVDDDTVVIESAGALDEGRKVFVTVRLPESVRIDAQGVNDEILPFIAAVNSHDGRSSAHVVVTPWRVLCRNTERFAVRDAVTKWSIRHTANIRWQVEEARRALRLSTRYYQQWAAEEESLARTQLAIDEYLAVTEDLWPAPEETASLRTLNNHRRRRDRLARLYETNTESLGATAYAGERAITEFLDWAKPIRPGHVAPLTVRATAAFEGAHDELKDRAHQRLLTLIRR